MVQLAHNIHKEARWDLRVNDLYSQRLATLLMIGRAYLIKPRWVERVMAKQLADGDWSWKSEPESPSHQHPTMQVACLLMQIRYWFLKWIDQHYPR